MRLGIVGLSTQQIKEIAEIDLNKETEYIEIPVISDNEYKKHKEERNRRVYRDRFGVDYDER